MISMNKWMTEKFREPTSKDSSTVVFDGLATGEADAGPASVKAATTRDATESFIVKRLPDALAGTLE